METKYIQIYGIQRSATTFTTRTISDNFENVFVSADGKHMEPATYEFIENNLRDRLTKDWIKKNKKAEAATIKKIKDVFELGKPIHPIIVIKNPYSWYLSVERWEKLRKGSFDLEKAKKWFIRYNANYKIWKELFEGPRRPFGAGLIITYEDLLRDTVGFLNNLKNVFGLKLKTKMLISDRMASADIEDKVKFFTEERKRFYLQNGNFSLPNEIVKTITELVDWDLMRFYGYRPKR